MKRAAAIIILVGTVMAVSGTLAIKSDWEKAKRTQQAKVEVTMLPSWKKEESTLVMIYSDGSSAELTGTINVQTRDGKWYIEFWDGTESNYGEEDK